MALHYDLGKKGEKMAAAYLHKNGYTILAQNWYYGKAEVDIIARKKHLLAVVEVKTRSDDYFGNPENFVSVKKRKLLIHAIDNYVTQNKLNVEVRFDIITLLKYDKSFKIQHIKNAFYPF